MAVPPPRPGDVPPPPRPTALRRWGARLAAALLGLAGAAAGLGLAGAVVIVWWAGREGSVRQALEWASPWLAQDRALQWEDASGGLLHGGRLARLRWQQPGLNVEVRELQWRLAPDLWSRLWRERRLAVAELAAAEITIRDERAPAPRTESPLPADLRLPWLHAASLPMAIGRLQWQDVALEDVRADYGYGRADDGPDAPASHAAVPPPSGYRHTLTVSEGVVRVAGPAGSLRAPLQGTVALQAEGPLRLTAEVRADLQARPVDAPAQRLATTLRMDGSLSGEGSLALTLTAEQSGGPARAHLRMTIAPWATWPLRAAEARVRALDLGALWPRAPRTRLHGELTWQPQTADRADGRVQMRLDNTRPAPWSSHGLPLRSLDLDLAIDGRRIRLASLQAALGGGRLAAHGEAIWRDDVDGPLWRRLQAPQGRLEASGIVPAQLWTGADPAPLQASVELRPAPPGRAGPGATAVTLTVAQGIARAEARGRWVHGTGVEGTVHATLPGLTANWRGALAFGSRPWPDTQASADNELSMTVHDIARTQDWLDAVARRWAPLQPSLPDRMAVLTAPALDGDVTLLARWGARLPVLHGAASPWSLRWQSGRLEPRTRPGEPPSSWRLRNAALALDGRDRQVKATAQTELTVATRRVRLTLDPTTVAWTGDDPRQGPLAASASRLHLTALAPAASPVSAADAVLAWDRLGWADQTLQASGRLEPLPLVPWLAWMGVPLPADAGLLPTLDFTIGGDWDVALPRPDAAATTPRWRLALERTRGDIRLRPEGRDGRDTLGGLRHANAEIAWDGRALRVRWAWDTERVGRTDGHLLATVHGPSQPPRLAPGWPLRTDTALDGDVRLDSPPLGGLSPWLPPGWRLDGRLQGRARLGGVWGAPTLDGVLEGDGLRLASAAEGIDWRDGTLRARLSERTLDITQLRLRGSADEADGGTLAGTGRVSWGPDGAAPVADLTLRAQRWRLLARADRRLTLSGELRLRADHRRLALSGQLRADQARWWLPDDDTPRLGDDVVVRGRAPAAGTGTPWPQGWSGSVDVALDLGRDFRLTGRGLDTGLEGTLRWTQGESPTPRLVGEVRSVRGRYRAYGQSLDIAQGTLRFGGAVDNPALELLAVRTLPQQTVGVAVTGTAQAPRVRLHAEPSLPDSETLAWLVLGRPATGTGAETAVLQRAALALLSGADGQGPRAALPAALGLDELGYEAGGPQADGSERAGAISLGKRLSNRLYLGYRRSLVGLVGTVSVLYDVSRFLTLRAQAGDDNAIELLYTRRYD